MISKSEFDGEIDVGMALEYAESERKGITLLRFLFALGRTYSPESFRALKDALEDLHDDALGMFRSFPARPSNERRVRAR